MSDFSSIYCLLHHATFVGLRLWRHKRPKLSLLLTRHFNGGQNFQISFFNNIFIFLNIDIKLRQVGFRYLHFKLIKKKVRVKISSQWHFKALIWIPKVACSTASRKSLYFCTFFPFEHWNGSLSMYDITCVHAQYSLQYGRSSCWCPTNSQRFKSQKQFYYIGWNYKDKKKLC